MLVQRKQNDGKFSDKFSDVTRTTTDDSCTSYMSDDVQSEQGTYIRQQSQISGNGIQFGFKIKSGFIKEQNKISRISNLKIFSFIEKCP